jgi:copper(I)-binding protein
MRLLFACAALFLAACQPGEPAIAVEDGWARATAPGQYGAAVYLTVVNRGGGADRLIEVSVSRAGHAMLHGSSMEGGVMRMRHLPDGLAIPPSSTVELAPNGPHIMLAGLGAPLRPGERFPVTLRFAKAGTKDAIVTVEDPSAR